MFGKSFLKKLFGRKESPAAPAPVKETTDVPSRPRPVKGFKDGEMHYFSSVTEASRKTGANRTSILKCLNGTRRQAGGYVWLDA